MIELDHPLQIGFRESFLLGQFVFQIDGKPWNNPGSPAFPLLPGGDHAANVPIHEDHLRIGRKRNLVLRLAHELVGAAVPGNVLDDLRPVGFDDALVAAARTHTFEDRSQTPVMTGPLVRLWRSSGLIGKLREFVGTLFLSKAEMASKYSVALDSPRIYLYYAVRLKDILTRYSRTGLGLWRGDPVLAPIARRKADLVHWLDGG